MISQVESNRASERTNGLAGLADHATIVTPRDAWVSNAGAVTEICVSRLLFDSGHNDEAVFSKFLVALLTHR